MTIIRCIAAAAVSAFLLTFTLISWRPPQGSGVVSQSGAEIITWSFLLVFTFCFLLLPSLIVGSIVTRKSSSKSQKAGMSIATVISIVLFIFPLQIIYATVIRHGSPHVSKAQRLEAERLDKEEPEYQRLFQLIREHPENTLPDARFYSRDNTPYTRAFHAALDDKSIHFPETTLIELLDKLPADNHWNRVQIFLRPELSSATIERFYPKALDWGANLNYEILANLARNPNTPRHILEDLASRGDIPVGGTIPAQLRLKQLQVEESHKSITNSAPKSSEH